LTQVPNTSKNSARGGGDRDMVMLVNCCVEARGSSLCGLESTWLMVEGMGLCTSSGICAE
jgi:hypothetical protein